MFAYVTAAVDGRSAARGRGRGASARVGVESLEFTVIDLETTGFSPARGDRVVEIGVVRVDGAGRVLKEWTTLVDPGRPVGPSHVHRITAADVAGAPRFEDVAEDLAALLSGAVVVAHNAPFEQRFLQAEFVAAGMNLPTLPALCTMRLAREVDLDVPDHKLGTCCEHFGLVFRDAHAALADARVTAQLLPLVLRGGAVRELELPVLPAMRVPRQQQLSFGGVGPRVLRPRRGFEPARASRRS